MKQSYWFRLGALFVFCFWAACLFHVASAGQDLEYAIGLRRQGLSAQQAGQYGTALMLYTRASVLLPRDPVLHNDMGLMNQALGHYKEAEASFRKALELDPSYVPVYSNLAMFYSEQGRYEEAVEKFRQRILLGKPGDMWILKAQERLEEIYARFPHLKGERLLDSARYLEEEVALEKSRIQAGIDYRVAVDFDLAMARGLGAFEARDYELAVGFFEEASRLRPVSAAAKHSLSRAREELRRRVAHRHMNDLLQAAGRPAVEVLDDQYPVAALKPAEEAGHP